MAKKNCRQNRNCEREIKVSQIRHDPLNGMRSPTAQIEGNAFMIAPSG